MKIHLQITDIKKQQKSCVIVGVFEQAKLTPHAKALDQLTDGALTKILKAKIFQGKIGETFPLCQLPAIENILLVGCGSDTKVSTLNFRKIANSSMKALQSMKISHATSYLTDLSVERPGEGITHIIKHLAEVTDDALYQFDKFKTQKEPIALQTLCLHVNNASQLKQAQLALKQGMAIAEGVRYTKDLANQPSNVCTPTYLAQQAKELTKAYPSISLKILEEADMKKLGMGAFLGVAKGSAEDAKLVCMEYQGSRKKPAPIVLVGKGITFDTGGISLKPQDNIVGMKYDMCGAATVLGTMKAIAELKLPLHVVGLLAATENMPGGHAYKPEDILTSMSGQTIEVISTDAEGRLVLCDTLTYCERYKPDVVIDVATLTGAIVVALGSHATGLLSNHDPLAKDLLAASEESADRAWQLPLWDDYQEQIKSPFADISNVGGKGAGAITAACFLSRFTKKFHWAHLDVAGTAAVMMGNGERKATGRPVPMLMQYLINRAGKL